MTMITPEEEIAHGTEVLNALYEALRTLRREIEELTDEARTGGDLTETSVSKSMRQVHGMVAQCVKAES
jgi:ferritin